MPVAFGKGMNSEEILAAIDARESGHFMTIRSMSFAQELPQVTEGVT